MSGMAEKGRGSREGEGREGELRQHLRRTLLPRPPEGDRYGAGRESKVPRKLQSWIGREGERRSVRGMGQKAGKEGLKVSSRSLGSFPSSQELNGRLER